MSTTVVLDYDPLWRPVEWAKKNCPSYITNTLYNKIPEIIDDRTKISYYFGDEQDAILFALRWR